jgi:beta-xylosidase
MIWSFRIVAVFLLGIGMALGAEHRFSVSGNPLFEGADPDVLFHDGKFWVYPTGSAPSQSPAFFTFSSTDLKSWTRHGPVLSFKDVKWIADDGAPRRYAWAPGVFRRDQRFYLYFSAGPNTPKPSRIGVAVADSPQGPFVDSGKSLIDGGNGFEAIDAMPFEVPGTRRVLLYCGGSAGAKLRVFELGSNLVTVAREIPVETPPKFTEGAFMNERNGVFYLSYSHGNYRDASYSVHYCTASSPTGPWRYEGAILTSDANHTGPGHHAILRRPDIGEWLIFYHRWNGAGRTGKLPNSRSVCVEPLRYDADGKILPVKMSESSARRPNGSGE